MTTYTVRHSTRYDYELPVLHSHHLARLRPRHTENQQGHLSEFKITPKPRSISRRIDYFGNETDTIEILQPHECLDVTVSSVVTVGRRPVMAHLNSPGPAWDAVAADIRDNPKFLRELEMCYDSPLVRSHPVFQAYAGPAFMPGRGLIEVISELNGRIYHEFAYEPATTDVSTPLGKVMRERRGVCQDFAHVAIGCFRTFGLAARYVSGYLETIPPAGQPRLAGADASHAWASVFVPPLGWIDFDPTNDVFPNDRHITVAWGRDFSDVSPLKGVVLGGGAHTLTVGVDVNARGSVHSSGPPPPPTGV